MQQTMLPITIFMSFVFNIFFSGFIRDMDILDKLGCHKACKAPSLGELFPETYFRCQVIGKKDMKTLKHGIKKEWLKKSWQN